jgi:hypothetical protein
MLALAFCLIGIGLLICLVAGIWSLVVAFQRHVLWGLAVLLVPFAHFVFLFVAWAEAKKPFLIGLVGMLVAAAGFFCVPKETLQSYVAMGTRGGPVQFDMGAAGAGDLQQAANTTPAAPSSDEVQKRLAALRTRESDLLARKAATDRKNAAAVAQLDAEIRQYNDELKMLEALK